MKITKLEHSGLAIEKNGKTLIFDPVEFTEKLPIFENVVAIIITHKHGDHLQPDKLAKILETNRNAKIFITPDAAEILPDAIIMKTGDSCEIGGFKLSFFGQNHAEIIKGQIPCDNFGVIVDDKIVNPGDSFDLPKATRPNILFVPLAAPWCKIAESVDFIKTAKPEIVIPFHDAVLSDFGRTVHENCLRSACDEIGTKFLSLAPNTSLDFPVLS